MDDATDDVMYTGLVEIKPVETRERRDNLASVLTRLSCEASCWQAAAYIKASPNPVQRRDAGHTISEYDQN